MHYKYSAEFRLCCAMVKAALADIVNYYDSKKSANYFHFVSAKRWVLSECDLPFSFNWVCSHLEGIISNRPVPQYLKELVTLLETKGIKDPKVEYLRGLFRHW